MHNTVHIIYVTEIIVYVRMVKIAYFIVYAFYHNKKKRVRVTT